MPFALSLDKTEEQDDETFIGQDALLKEQAAGGPGKRLTGLVIDSKRTARQSMTVKAGDETVGEVTSGCMSPTLGKSIAIAMIDDAHAEPGTTLQVDTGKAQLDAQTVPLPFYKAPKPG
jgi:aminomethyltransferase